MISYFIVSAVESSRLHLTKISRLQMGKYLCVATNGVNPSTSKMFDTKVQCKQFSILESIQNFECIELI